MLMKEERRREEKNENDEKKADGRDKSKTRIVVCHYAQPTTPRLHQRTCRPCHPPTPFHPGNIWGSVPGHGSPPLPGDKMEREGIRLTVRCVTRSSANEKQVEAPHSSLRPPLAAPRGTGEHLQFNAGERENRCLKVHETRPSLISQLSLRLPIECLRPVRTHRHHWICYHCALLYASNNYSDPRFFTVIYSCRLAKENVCVQQSQRYYLFTFFPSLFSFSV